MKKQNKARNKLREEGNEFERAMTKRSEDQGKKFKRATKDGNDQGKKFERVSKTKRNTKGEQVGPSFQQSGVIPEEN